MHGTWGWINIKSPSYQYRNSHSGDKTIIISFYFHNGISYTGKTTSLYWIIAHDVVIGPVLVHPCLFAGPFCGSSQLWGLWQEAPGNVIVPIASLERLVVTMATVGGRGASSPSNIERIHLVANHGTDFRPIYCARFTKLWHLLSPLSLVHAHFSRT